MVEAAPVNLGELGVVGEVAFFGGTGLPVPVESGAETGAEVKLARVVGQALMVTVTTDGTTGATLVVTWTGAELAIADEVVFKYALLLILAGQLVTEAGQAIQ